MYAAAEHLRVMSNIFGPPQQVRQAFLLMPVETADDWATIARRLAAVPAALAGTARRWPKEPAAGCARLRGRCRRSRAS